MVPWLHVIQGMMGWWGNGGMVGCMDAWRRVSGRNRTYLIIQSIVDASRFDLSNQEQGSETGEYKIVIEPLQRISR